MHVFIRLIIDFRYIDPNLYLSLKHEGLVEYRQANLTIPATVESVFEPPEGKPAFSIVYDLSGEKAYDRPEIVCARAGALLEGSLLMNS